MADNTDDTVDVGQGLSPEKLTALLAALKGTSVSPSGDVVNSNTLAPAQDEDNSPYGTTDKLYGTNVPMPKPTPSTAQALATAGSTPAAAPLSPLAALLAAKTAAPSKDEDADEDQPQDLASKLKALQAARAAQPGSTNNRDYLNGVLGKIYGSDLGDPALKEAQQRRNAMQTAAMMMQGGNEIASGLAMGRGGYAGVNNAIPNAMLQKASEPVQDILTRRAGKVQEMEAGLKASDLEDREKLRDSSSDVSEAYRNMALQLNPKLSGMPSFESMNAEGVKQLMPMVDLSIKMQMAQSGHQEKMQEKEEQDQAKAKAEVSAKIGTILNRGTNARATDVDRRVTNALSIINDPRWANNLNAMPHDQVNALKDEMAQIFTGGMSTEAKTAKLMSPDLASKITNLYRGVAGATTGAQMGAFIQEYKPYLQELQKNSRSYVGDQIKPLLTGYNKRLAPDDLDEMNSAYGKYLGTQEQPKSSNAKTGNVPAATLAGYAQKHGLTPDEAAKSLKDQGYTVEGY